MGCCRRRILGELCCGMDGMEWNVQLGLAIDRAIGLEYSLVSGMKWKGK